MRLAQLHEARYRDQSEWVEWVRTQFDKVGPDPIEDKICLGNEREVLVKELHTVIKELTRTFGKPIIEDTYKDQHHQWVWRLGEPNGYRITVFPWGIGEIFTGICVGRDYET